MKILCSAGKGELETQACLACALREINPPCGYDYSLLRSLLANDGEDRRGAIHVTDLTGCIRKAWYSKVNPAPEYVHERLTRWLGTSVHTEADTNEDDHYRCEMELAYAGIVGRADVVYHSGVMLDYKTTRWLKPESLPYGSHVLQLNVYAWMHRHAGYPPVERLLIQYIDMSGPTKCRACKLTVRFIEGEIRCPSCLRVLPGAHLGAMLYEVPLMTDEEVEYQILDRKKELEAAIASGIAPTAEPGYLCSYCPALEVCNPHYD